MVDTQAYIRDQITKKSKVRQAPKPQQRRNVVAAQSLPKTKKEKSGFLTAFLATGIVLMMVATMGGLILKSTVFASDNRVASVVAEPQYAPPVVRNEPVVPVTPDHTVEIRELSDKVNHLSKNYKVWAHRTWLLGLAVNENANIDQRVDTRYHGNRDSGFIRFDTEWKMNKMPETMTLTPEQRDSIRNGP